METWGYIVVGISALIFIVGLVMLCLAFTKYKNKANAVKIKDGIRYSKDSEIADANNEAKVTFNSSDFILKRGTEYTAIKDTALMPGTYTVLASNEKNTKFNLRIQGIVREYKHGDKIVLSNGDTICAVSHAVILR